MSVIRPWHIYIHINFGNYCVSALTAEYSEKLPKNNYILFFFCIGLNRSRYSGSLQAARTGDLILVGAIFSKSVQTGNGAHPASFKIGNGSLSQGYSSHGVALTTHLHLAPRLKKEYSYTPTRPWSFCVHSRVNYFILCSSNLDHFYHKLYEIILKNSSLNKRDYISYLLLFQKNDTPPRNKKNCVKMRIQKL